MAEQLDQTARPEPAELNISTGWVQGIALVMVFGFFVMGLLALRTYTDSMPRARRGHHRRAGTLPATEDHRRAGLRLRHRHVEGRARQGRGEAVSLARSNLRNLPRG